MSTAPSILSGFLETPRGPLSVFTTAPAEAPPRGVVLLCPPIFEERKASAGAFSALAAALAETGLATLRFDPRGTGDSPGSLREATAETWRANAREAAAAVRDLGAPVFVLGVRFGALLALEALVEGSAAAVVLWEPVSDGAEALQQAVRRKLVNDMAAFGAAAAGRGTLDAAWARGETVDLDGYPVSAALRDGLCGFAPPPVPAGVPALLVTTRPGREAESRAAKLCPEAERQVHPSPPFWNAVGLVDVQAAVAAIVAWIRARIPEVPCSAAWPPRLAARHGGETHAVISSPRGTALPAVWHAPGREPPRWRALCLPGWSGCRLGPHNVFVELARRASREGVETLRLDVGGRGDSLEDPPVASIRSMTRDACAALAALRDRDPPGVPLALVAICSGCKVAIGVAAEDPAIPLLVLWSPEPMGSLRPAATNRRKTRAMLRLYLLKLGRADTWRKLLRGRVRGAMVGKALLGHETRGADEAEAEDAVLERFRAFRGRVVCVFGGGDPEAAGSEAAYRRFFARHGIPCACHTIPRAGHSFYGAAWADALLDRTLAAFRESP